MAKRRPKLRFEDITDKVDGNSLKDTIGVLIEYLIKYPNAKISFNSYLSYYCDEPNVDHDVLISWEE